MSAPSSIRIGTRGSPLALWQANWVKSRLESKYPTQTCELVIIKTAGDASQLGNQKLDNKAQFVKEIEDALLKKEIDVAVHSMKDMPGLLPEGLVISAIPERENPQDVIITRDGIGYDHLSAGASIGTSSVRRQCQLKQIRPDFNYLPIRGNVETRINKLNNSDCDAIILAKAGLLRLGVKVTWQDLPMIPAVGQGALAIETRDQDANLVQFLDHADSSVCVRAERHFLALMGGSCQVPMACYVKKTAEDNFFLEAFLSEVDGSDYKKVFKSSNQNNLIKTVESIVKELNSTLYLG